MSLTETTLGGEDLIGGEVKDSLKTMIAGTYFRGQLLGRITASNKYAKYNQAGGDGTEVPRAVCLRDEVTTGDESRQVYVTGSEVRAGGLKDDAGAALVVTDAIKEKLQDVGILVKEN
jgi:hypothetical protein